MCLSSKSADELESNSKEEFAIVAKYLTYNDLVINLKNSKAECMLLGTSNRTATAAHDSRDMGLFCHGT